MNRKQRRAAQFGQPRPETVPYFDIATGKTATARAAGDPLEWRSQHQANTVAVLLDKPPPHAVPCGDCTQCCYHAGVDVHPEMEPPERLAHLEVEFREGGWFLRKRADGACVHLGPKGCTVYAHRPNACRLYDCRLHALVCVLDSYSGDHKQPAWMFQPKTNESRAFMAACGMLGQIETIKRQRSGCSWSAPDVAAHVLAHPKFAQLATAMLALANADPETQKQMLGFDPSKITPEQIAETYQRMIARPTGEGAS
jgi:hypothetical protein